jgi:hypothetical protein
MSRTTCGALVLLLCAGCGATGSPTQLPSEPATGQQLEPAVILLDDYAGALQTASVEVAGRTLPFLFDTGGGVTVVTTELARQAGREPFGRISAFRMSGERVDAERCGSMILGIGGHVVEVETAVFDLMSLLPQGWPELGGLLSLQTFRDEAITLDLGAGKLIVESDSSLDERLSLMQPMSARLGLQAGGSSVDLFVEVRAEQGSLWLELDSGNTGHVLLAPHALRQLGLEEGAEADVRTLTLEFVGLGPIEVLAREREMIYDGLLNLDTMKRLVLTADLETGRLWGMRRQE